MQPASPALDFKQPRTRLAAFCLIGILGAVLLISPTLFYISVIATAVLSARLIPAALPPDPSLQRLIPLIRDNSHWICLAVCICWIGASPSLPPDDLLRHILSAGWGYNYLPHYNHHLLPTTWSWSIGFDFVAGQIHSLTGDTLTTVRVIRGLETAFVGSMLVLAVCKATKSPSLRFFAIAISLVGMVFPRLYLGRPEVIFTGVVFAAFTFRRGTWLALFAGLSCAYAFSPIYAAAALLLGSPAEPLVQRAAKNLAVAVTAAASAIAIWMVYTGGQYTLVYTLLQTVLQVQVDNKIAIGELLPLTEIMGSPVALMICFGLLAIVWKRASYIATSPEVRIQLLLILAVALYFSLPNYVRYASIIWPLFVVAALLAIGDDLPASYPRSWIWVAGAVFIAANVTPRSQRIDEAVLKTMRVPAGSTILAPFNSSSYIASAANPDAVVTPIFDMSTVTHPAQGVVRKLSEGSLDCDAATSLRFGYLIENTLKGQAPACVQLLAIEGDHRLWRFVR